MSSMGASYAAVYVQQKRQKERLLKKMEACEKSAKLVVEKPAEKEASRCKADKICGAGNKIHPAHIL